MPAVVTGVFVVARHNRIALHQRIRQKMVGALLLSAGLEVGQLICNPIGDTPLGIIADSIAYMFYHLLPPLSPNLPGVLT